MSAIDSPQAHLRVYLQHAILRIAAYLNAVADGIPAPYGFLNAYIASARQQIQSQLPPHAELPQSALTDLDRAWGEAIAQWEKALVPNSGFPLLRLRQSGLADHHLQALMLIGLVELDARFSTVYRALDPFPDELRLTVGLLDDLLHFNRAGAAPGGWQVARDLEQRGLVTIHYPDRPRAARTLSIPAPVWDACGGESIVWPSAEFALHPKTDFASLDDLKGLLPAELLQRLGRVPTLVESRLIDGIILRGMRGSGRLRALGAVARLMDRDVLHIRCSDQTQLAQVCRLAGPLALLLNALPVLDLELAPGDAVVLPPLAGHEELVGMILNREGSIVEQALGRCLTLHLPAPDTQARRRQWTQVLAGSLNGGAPQIIDAVSRNYHLTLGGVERAGQLAHAYAALAGRAHVEVADVQEATRALNQQSLENLARRIHTTSGWDAFVIAPALQEELNHLILRCRHREDVLTRLGRGFRGTARGVRALFSGPSGTGKTLAARIVAAELGLDLYRVDLSSIVSKYIGETERNLSQLFARAEEQDIVLLLDEGDSLLTARTDVRNSTDRYANMETNYLLQRLEDYEGIILITSNAADRIDSAFQRRMDVSIEFRAPDAAQRQQLWKLHLPDDHAVGDPFLRTVALRCQLTGGQIRNAVFHATVLALEADTAVGEPFVIAGIAREYAKIGAAMPLTF